MVEAVYLVFSNTIASTSFTCLIPPCFPCSPPHPLFPFSKSLEWPSEAVRPVWYVRNSAEQTWRGRRVEEEDEGRVLFQIFGPKPQKTQSEGKGKCSRERRTVWETLKGLTAYWKKKQHFFSYVRQTDLQPDLLNVSVWKGNCVLKWPFI